jgi:hypothetical protein
VVEVEGLIALKQDWLGVLVAVLLQILLVVLAQRDKDTLGVLVKLPILMDAQVAVAEQVQ